MVVKIQIGKNKKEEARLATERQIDYLKMLAKETNYTPEKPFEECTMEEASKLIDVFLEKVNQAKPGDKQESEPKPRPVASKSNYAASARFGLAFKLVFTDLLRRDYWPPKQKQRESFIEKVCEVYDLMNEAAQKAGLQ